MIEIPFHKLHGAENDFLLSWASQVPDDRLPEIAQRICARNTGIGADGWMLVWEDVYRDERAIRTRLFNSDGSEPEISGNGTRCAAAFAVSQNALTPPRITVLTAAGRKRLELISQTDSQFIFEMDMGQPRCLDLHTSLQLAGSTYDATILDVGNPQCAIFVHNFPSDWRMAAAEAERHERFPNRSNVSFVRVIDSHTIEAVFYERGAGETRSSGTGSTGAAAAAILRNVTSSPIEVRTPAGALKFRWEESVYLTGPAELIGAGSYFLNH